MSPCPHLRLHHLLKVRVRMTQQQFRSPTSPHHPCDPRRVSVLRQNNLAREAQAIQWAGPARTLAMEAILLPLILMETNPPRRREQRQPRPTFPRELRWMQLRGLCVLLPVPRYRCVLCGLSRLGVVALEEVISKKYLVRQRPCQDKHPLVLDPNRWHQTQQRPRVSPRDLQWRNSKAPQDSKSSTQAYPDRQIKMSARHLNLSLNRHIKPTPQRRALRISGLVHPCRDQCGRARRSLAQCCRRCRCRNQTPAS